MKLKHWQGYGSVNAERVEKTPTSIVIKVQGAHEYGLVRDDIYDAKKWLLDRFLKEAKEVSPYKLTLVVYERAWNEALYIFHPKFGMTWKEVIENA